MLNSSNSKFSLIFMNLLLAGPLLTDNSAFAGKSSGAGGSDEARVFAKVARTATDYIMMTKPAF